MAENEESVLFYLCNFNFASWSVGREPYWGPGSGGHIPRFCGGAKNGAFSFGADLDDAQLYADAENNIFGSNDNWAFHQQVYKEVDSHLIFDSILARYAHFGVVYLEFSVDSKGSLLEPSLRASAKDPILKVHAVRALRSALSKEFEPTKWSVLDKPVVFRAKFEFTHEKNSQVNFQKQNAFSDPVFVFRRSTEVAANHKPQDDNFNNLGDFFDYEEVGRKLKNRQKNRVLRAGDFDPFAGYRSDPAYIL